MLLRLQPWRLDTHEGIEFVEDFVRLVTDLAVESEEREGFGLAIGGEFVGQKSAIGFGEEDEAVDVLAELK